MKWKFALMWPLSAAMFALGARPAPISVLADPAKLVQRAIDYAGGFRAWDSKKSLEFKKTVTRLNADGSVLLRRVEHHRYRLKPSFGARIERDEDGKKVLMINNGRTAWKFVDGQQAQTQADVNGARGATFGSHYVIGMPFKLLDPGVHLADAGKQKIADSMADGVRATYDKGVGDAGGFHIWTYYFDTKTGRLTANHLNYETDKYDYTEYYDDKEFSGVRLATRRKAYNADARRKIGPETSEITYEDVRFDVPVDDSMFRPPKR